MNNEKGTIYLIQPAELVGTERYKIGCSAKNDLERCKKGYKKGTRFMDIRECDDPFAVEREVKTNFNNKFNLVAGKEYFEGNEADIKKEFNYIVSKFTLLKRDDVDDDIYFKFKSQKISVNPLLPKSKALFNPPYINVPTIEHELSPKPETIDKLLKLKEPFIKNDGLTNAQRVQLCRQKEYQKNYQKEYGKEHFQQIKSDRKHCDCCNKDVLIYTWSKHIITDLHRNNMNK